MSVRIRRFAVMLDHLVASKFASAFRMGWGNGGSMHQSVTGCVVDETTGKPLTSPDVRLYRIGVAGEKHIPLDEYGCFGVL